jgi:hypothetical protein
MGTTSMSTATTLAAAKKKRIAARAAARSDRGVMLAIYVERERERRQTGYEASELRSEASGDGEVWKLSWGGVEA